MTQLPLRSSFAQFRAQFDALCESALGQALNDHRRIKSSGDGLRLSAAVDQLDNVLLDIETRYGSKGPPSPWNTYFPQDTPFQARSRPTTPYSGLHPNSNFSNGAPSPPSTPVTADYVAEAKAELEALSKALKDCNAELKEAKKEIKDYQAENHRFQQLLEPLRLQLAHEYTSSKKYLLAAEQYESLADLKTSEKRRRRIKGETSAEIAAEKSFLDYKYQQGKMLLHAGNYIEAEEAVRFVFETKKAQDDRKIDKAEVRRIQLELCKILRLQKSKDKSREAEMMCYQASSMTHLEFQNEGDRSWILLNAFYLAFIWVEQGLYDDAIRQLRKVWPKRLKASGECIQTLESEIPKVIDLLERRKEKHQAIKVLQLFCDNSNGVTAQNWHYFANLGKYLSQSEDHERAITYSQRAWISSVVNSSQKRELGWLLALSLSHMEQFGNAESIITHLLDSSPVTGSPGKTQLKALLAYVQLHTNQLAAAETNARLIFDQEATRNILPTHAFHPADTLIYALVKQDSKQKYLEARKVWQKLYDQKDQLALSSDGKVQLKFHATAGRKLVLDWIQYWKKRNVTPNIALKVKREVEEMEKEIARVA